MPDIHSIYNDTLRDLVFGTEPTTWIMIAVGAALGLYFFFKK